MRIDDFGGNADGGNIFVGEILLGGTLNSKWRKMGDHHVKAISRIEFDFWKTRYSGTIASSRIKYA